MKQNFFYVLRLGIPSILPIDQIALGDAVDLDSNELAGTSVPFGIVSIIKTDMTASEIVDRYIEAAAQLDDHAPVVVWSVHSDSADFDLMDFTNVYEMTQDFLMEHSEPQKNDIKSTPLDLDAILDKISREGMDSLTSVELALLKDASNS